ncbi:FAD-binding oxidoreductase, partial [Microbacterium sp.]|uniref:FAD-binding oxidoreductase n=1 Tax=Microbacterium sp. TaxID=51671 RepID=UPI003C731BD7
LGWFARSHGLAANQIVAVEAVDAQGRVVTADADRNPDLFWALRGGTAPVVVTAVELALVPVAQVWAGGLLWPLERAADVAHAWREWTETVPDAVTSLARILRYPPLPELPDALRGRSFVSVEVAIQADADEAARLLEPLRALAPELDTVRPMPPSELSSVHGDPVDPVPARGEAVVLSELTPASVGAVLDAALAPAAAPLLSIEVRQLGGALSPGRGDGGAVSAVDGAGLVFVLGIVPVPEAAEQVRAAAAHVIDGLGAYSSGAVVKNFAETPAPASAVYGAAVTGLREVAAAWDPDGVINLGHPLD